MEDWAKKVENKFEKPISAIEKFTNKIKGTYQKWNSNSKKMISTFVDQFDRGPDGKRVKRFDLESVPSLSKEGSHYSSESSSS